ncbi:solute carrier organic anion transporter family member 2A1 [Dendroctonus ponderosae]|uniref:solute carrier organic anion transporter family member 2A1 n=1 Tax=Dendroctonus ponderosae TaxID=77166 RepID=UPI002035C259|nr:solute carrier organic anion transporter family member 2A1 [Dendroctonus ponderosae]KAH1029931.1 hypothetical protein HUJ05_003077 [Dendroctonus ponderosae]
MVHPTELLRTDSTGDEGSFIAPVGDYRNDVDCGCSVLPCLTQRLNLEKYAKPTFFVGVLSFAGFFSGIALKYFRGTSQIWSQHYNIPQDTIDWLLYINEIFVGGFALLIAYWGNRMHRVNWLGAFTIYLGVSCFTLAIPEFYQPFNREETDINVVNGRVLCRVSNLSETRNISMDVNNHAVAFIIVICHQIVVALYTISFVALGITYIDDNSSATQSPIYIALAFGAQRLGKQTGIYSAWLPLIITKQSVFVTITWLSVAVLLLLTGCLIAMFPKVMPSTLLRKSVNSLLSIASGNAVIESRGSVDGFFTSLGRILRNRVLLLNIVAMTCMQAAIINFSIQEKFFNQSKYHVSKYNDVSGYSDPMLIQFSTNLLKQPLVAVAYICVGIIIAKMNPTPKLLIMWNILVFGIVLVTFAAIRFFSCTTELHNELAGALTIPYCSWHCGCSLDGPFQPICLNGETHFSPCWAGCSSFDSSLKIYENCTCAGESRRVASEGSCDADSCSTLWALAQAHGVVSSALLGTTFITTLIINLRCIARKDKALALGLHMTCISLIPYLPIRAIYDVIAGNFCQMWGKSTCQFYSDQFAVFIAVLTVSLKAAAILLSIVLLFFIDKINLYSSNKSRKGSDEDLPVLRRPGLLYGDANASTSNDPNGFSDNSPQAEEHEIQQYPLLKNKQKSDSKLDTRSDRSSKSDRINAYLSEGDLVPPLKANLRLGKSASKNSNSNNSALSNDSSLSEIANTVGDDHDSDFSTLQRPQRIKMLDSKLQQHLEDSASNSDSDRAAPTNRTPLRSGPKSNNIEETEF